MIIFVGDIHCDSRVGQTTTKELLKPKIDKIIDLINQQDKVVFLGDYFNPSNPENQNREFLSNILKQIKIPMILLIGNHDRDKNGSFSLAAVRPLLGEGTIIVDDYYEEGDFCYISYSLDIEHIEDIISKTKCKYIVGHFSFEYENRGRILKGELSDSGRFKDKTFILGHIHKHSINGNLIYTGSVAPHKLDEIDYPFRLLLLNDKTGAMEWKNIKYDLNNITIKDVSELGLADENTKVVFEVNSVEEKNKILEQLKDKKLLDVKIIVKNTGIDISNLNISSMVKEYLKVMGREDLFDKVMAYVPEEKR